MDKITGQNRLKNRLASASEQDLFWAAEAVVDAALWANRARHHTEVTAETRLLLIEAIFADPSLTRSLFQNSALSIKH